MPVIVLMAVYNGASTIRAAVESVLAQTYRDWQLLIVDDGSTDGTRDVIRLFADSDCRVRPIFSATNRGAAAARNLGWRQTKDEFVAVLDADDISLPRRLERQVAFLQAHPEVDVLGTGMEVMDETGKVHGCEFPRERHEEMVKHMYKENPFAHPSVMMRRRFLEALEGYDERLRRSQDADLWLRGYRRFRYHNLQEPLIRYSRRRRPALRDCLYSSYVLLRAALREGSLLSRGWYAIRPLAAGLRAWSGLRRAAQPRGLKQTKGSSS